MPSLSTKAIAVFSLAWITGAAGPLQAANPSEDEFFGALPIVLSATRLAQTPIELPSSVTVIDRELIVASGARQLADVFALVPGFQVGYHSGNRPVVVYHGLGDEFSRRLQVLIDGRSVYVPLYGGVPWENLPLAVEDIERIEVIRGPNAATFGPNSFQAVINITTRHSAEEQGVMLRGNRGEDGVKDGLVRFSGAAGEGFYRLTLAHQTDTGFIDEHDASDSDMFSFRYDRALNPRDELTFQAGRNRGRNARGSGENQHYLYADSSYLQLRWERNFNVQDALMVQFYASRYEIDEIESDTFRLPVGTARATFDGAATTERYDLEMQWSGALTERLRGVLGASLRQDRVLSEGFFNSDDWLTNNVQRVLGHVELRATDDLLLNVGTLVEHNEITGTDSSPRIALIYRIDDNQSLRYAISQATRTPVLFEEASDQRIHVTLDPDAAAVFDPDEFDEQIWKATGDLDPEEIQSVELGYRLENHRHQVSLDAKLFRDRITGILNDFERTDIAPSDLFQTIPDAHANSVELTIKGAELGLDWSPHRDIRLFAGYTYLETDGNERDHVRSVPAHIGSLLGLYRLSARHSISFDYSYQDTFEWVDGNVLDSYERLDLQFRETFHWGRNPGSFSLVLENVIRKDRAYDDDLEPTPRAFIRLGLLLP